ncbi:DUF3466 family protein [Psychromonas aquatilis]|uniref:DUF3466 family protein n=1 Tax=Psychromonas aquatilis TaxID=2005072 RepID=A0ABU9GTG4_9GAMM
MKYTVNLSIIALLSTGSAWAATTAPYYEYEILSVDTTGSNYGPYPSGLTEDGDTYSVYATKSKLDQNTDSGLPYTFNQDCFYDDEVCALLYEGSDSSTELSYENAYEAWRTASAYIDQGILDAESYFFGATNNVAVTGFGDDTDVSVTDVVNLDSVPFAVGYGSAPYSDSDSSRTREFVRRGFITGASTSDATISLLPDFYGDSDDDVDSGYDGGYSSAYKMREVTYEDGTSKTLVVGNSSMSWADGDDELFDRCYNEGDDGDEDDLGYLLYCPGFDTQAWAWEYDSASSETELTGFALATEWLDDNETNDGSNATYSAAALDINSSGIAVGVSTYEYNNNNFGGHQRAIIMTPDDNGNYGAPTELTAATDDISDQEDSIYNTWAKTITDDNLVMGNREYSTAKGRNFPNEMFIYDIDNDSITFPFLDKKVLTTEQRLDGESASFSGAGSEGYDMNNNGLVVGKVDAYDETDPVVGSIPRTQSAFLYDNTSGDSWYIDDLLCSEDADGVVTHPLIRLQSATAINDDGVVIAEGYQYSTDEDYNLSVNATSILVKLTPDASSTPDDSPNCWESETLSSEDETSERSGGASVWLWLFALPVLLLRRKKSNS